MTARMGMDPDEVARMIVAGVRANAAYVVTHPGIVVALEQRFASLTAAINRPARPGATPGPGNGRL